MRFCRRLSAPRGNHLRIVGLKSYYNCFPSLSELVLRGGASYLPLCFLVY